MGENTGIPYCTTTHNPVIGCRPITQGCLHCYAGRVACARLRDHGDYRQVVDVPHSRFNGQVVCRYEEITKIGKWRRPRVVFLSNMGDLFYDDVPTNFHETLWREILAADQHVFLLLTKRPLNMEREIRHVYARIFGDFEMANHIVPRHIWLGVSCEDQKAWDMRVPVLRRIPAHNLWVSAEPLLGPIQAKDDDFGPPNTMRPEQKVSWVVPGGESGPRARQCHVDWVRSLRDQANSQGSAVFVKQLGANPVFRDRYDLSEQRFSELDKVGWDEFQGPPTLHSRAGADPDEWGEDLRMRELPFRMPS